MNVYALGIKKNWNSMCSQTKQKIWFSFDNLFFFFFQIAIFVDGRIQKEDGDMKQTFNKKKQLKNWMTQRQSDTSVYITNAINCPKQNKKQEKDLFLLQADDKSWEERTNELHKQ